MALPALPSFPSFTAHQFGRIDPSIPYIQIMACLTLF